MPEFTPEDLVEELALRASTLVVNPNSVPARRAMRASLSAWRAWKGRRRLVAMAAESDAAARARPGFRADVEG